MSFVQNAVRGVGGMSFTAKSSWFMAIASLLLAIVYGQHLIQTYQAEGGVPVPDAGFITRIAAAFVILVIIGHIGLGILFYKDAAEEPDERDWSVIYKAGGASGSLLGFGVAGGIWYALIYQNSDISVHYSIMALILASFLNYALRVWFYRGHD